MVVTFDEWTQRRSVLSLGTNAGTSAVPFQSWRHFKEAFAPELVARAMSESEVAVTRCLDPFGGSGTTSIACQFLGVHPATIEVNPFLADLIEAKLSSYDPDLLVRDFGLLVKHASKELGEPGALFVGMPPTFIEPGVGDRWIFDTEIAARIAAWINSIARIASASHRRLFTVLLGGILIEVSNVIVSGKGRRYRRGWERNQRAPSRVDKLFCEAVQRAIFEIHRHAARACASHDVYRGDCRKILEQGIPCDIAIFSPPYPNSFDYTDVYNVELWLLGYLTGWEANRALRESTLSSHVQVSREFPLPPAGSAKLDHTLGRLSSKKTELWDERIPAMVGAYFTDLLSVLGQIRKSLTVRGSVWMVVGDSRYANIQIKTADILAELAVNAGWQLKTIEDCRSMRSSPQQGGQPALAETLVVLANC